MAPSIGPVAAVPKASEHIAAIQSEIEQLKQARDGWFPVDSAVLDVLPRGFERAYATRTSACSFTAKVVTFQDGKTIPYFLKYVPGELGRQQLFGEFTGMTELWKLSPEFVVKPVGWGKLADESEDWYFLLMEFKEFSEAIVNADKLAEKVVELHRRSQAQSDTGGRFGFHIQTFDGTRLQSVGWDPSWVSFFSKLLEEAYRQDTEAHGVWPELEEVYQKVQSHLIPRLLGVLEENGRKVTPTLIHGDMWEGNVRVEAATGEPWIFDCAAYYGHHEMELGIWRASRHVLNDNGSISAYLQRFAPQGYSGADYYPDDEAADRILLYSSKTNFMYSACFTNAPPRKENLDNFRYLLNKYGIEIEEQKCTSVSFQPLVADSDYGTKVQAFHTTLGVTV